jgi:hypothetical protein
MSLRVRILETVARLGDVQSSSTFLDEEERYVFDERAAIMEFDGGLSREEAERLAMGRTDRKTTDSEGR